MNKSIIHIGKRSKLLKRLLPSIPHGQCISFDQAYTLHLTNYFDSKIVVLFSIPESSDYSKYTFSPQY